ncbi:hypothetical protein AEA09_03705 [Lysinibacillus contaminans]|uniref:Uncharacterized protein n=1 Tax=Lysinibacillus contaminans TaxID=1293441 RepID=A0ABR5JZ80_9BACI|nr:hypothetical protein [Lysinibacillus contaminans]KOS67752.1 hypothetical protein AEA09_03705 [Lysinibacillus contaminans]
MKKIFLTLLTAIALFLVTDATTLAATNDENYDAYPGLERVVDELKADGSKEAIVNLEKIEALPEKELINLNDILTNPDRLSEELSNPENLTVESIEVDYTNENGLRNPFMTPFATTYKGQVTVVTALNAAGIDLIKYELTGKVTVNSTKTKFVSADSMNGIVIRKWLPQVVTKKLSSTKSVTSTKFTGQVTFSYDLGVGSWGVARIGVVRTGFTANTKQALTKWCYTE